MKSTWMMMGLGCAMSGCSHGTPTGGMDVPPPELVQLVVDADRNGVADPKAMGDVKFGAAWDAMHGAVMLANVDDDDADQKVDADDEVVNGDADALDLARMWVASSPSTPTGATGMLAVDHADNVRLFRHGGDGSWTLWQPADTLAEADL